MTLSRSLWALVLALSASGFAACGGGHGATTSAGGGGGSPATTTGAGAGGGAMCEASQTQCTEGCVDTKTDPKNCGGCGLACKTGDVCCAGAGCSSDPACALTVTSVSVDSGLINGADWVVLHGTGFAKGLSTYLGDGRAPTRVVDDKTAMILTPPAPEGIYDVEVRLGALRATLPRAFTVGKEAFGAKWVNVPMSTPRGNFPGMTTLQDGRVLVEGGSATSDPATALDTAELFDPTTKMTTVAAGKMSLVRHTTSAITLLDGRALVVGVCNAQTGPGCITPGDRALADLFDPVTNTFTPTKTPLNDTGRVYINLSMLPDGRVLVTGASTSGMAEIFDPETDSFTTTTIAAGGMPARLRDGRVLFVGGALQVFDPDAFALSTITGSVDHSPQAVYTLPDGRVGCVGGAFDKGDGMVTPSDALVVIDVKNQTVTTMPQKLSSPRLKFASAFLGNGTAMVAGGVEAPYPQTFGCQQDVFPLTQAVDVVDFAAGAVTSFPTLDFKEMELVAVTLLDGSILIGGGAACGGGVAYPYLYFLQGLPSPK